MPYFYLKRLFYFYGFAFLFLLLNSCNSYLFYQAPRYDQETIRQIQSDSRVLEISYTMPFGKQTSFYITPEVHPDQIPDRLWILFGGINTPAYGWYQWFKDIPDKRCGLLLIEYPGYGLCQGIPREERILQSSLTAYRALALHFHVPFNQLQKNLGLLGHSLGSLTMLQFAPHVKAKKILLISPITSLAEQVQKMYGSFKGSILNIINPEKYDNRARIKELLALPNPPQISIMHGAQDELIPVIMGRELAALGPDHKIKYYEIPENGHSGLIKAQLTLIHHIMFETISDSSYQNTESASKF